MSVPLKFHKVYSVDGGPPRSAVKCGLGYLHSKKVRSALEGLKTSRDYFDQKVRPNLGRKF